MIVGDLIGLVWVLLVVVNSVGYLLWFLFYIFKNLFGFIVIV